MPEYSETGQVGENADEITKSLRRAYCSGKRQEARGKRRHEASLCRSLSFETLFFSFFLFELFKYPCRMGGQVPYSGLADLFVMVRFLLIGLVYLYQ